MNKEVSAYMSKIGKKGMTNYWSTKTKEERSAINKERAKKRKLNKLK